MKTAVVSHGYYQPYFYWMFPIIVAKEEHIFEKHGIELKINDITPQGQPEDKANWYSRAFQGGLRDFYFCCAWQGIYSTSETGKGRIGAAIRSTLLKTFAIYTHKDGQVSSIIELAEKGIPIAVNKNADAHYITLKNLQEFIPSSKIKFSHIGGIERCFRALIRGEVEAATLAGPYAEAAEAIGYRRLLPLSRNEPTVIVFSDTLDRKIISLFIGALNEAIELINRNRQKYRERFIEEFVKVANVFIPELVEKLPIIVGNLTLPVWANLEEFSRKQFEEIHSFLIEHGLLAGKRGYNEIVDSNLLTVQ